MSLSQIQLSEDLHDQATILVGSAIHLLCGEAGVFVVSNEAFDPQSSAEYILYQLNEDALPTLLASAQEGVQPNSARPLIVSPLSPAVAIQLGLNEASEEKQCSIERCSLFLQDHKGVLGVIHFLRPAGAHSCFERHMDAGRPQGSLSHTRATARVLHTIPRMASLPQTTPDPTSPPLHVFITYLAAGLRSALKSQSLVKERERLSAIFEHSTEGMLIVDNALRIIDFNPSMERLTGWSESEVLGRFYYEVLRPRDRQGNELGLQGSPILQAFAGQVVENREMVISARDGQRFDVSVTASCVRSAWGEPVNGILNVRDITHEREQEEQRSTFISVISHELQTPIAIIKGYASTLARSLQDEAVAPRFIEEARFEGLRSRLLAVEEEADRLNKLVGNLLYASRIQAGGLQMETAPLDVAHLVQGVVHRLQAKSPDIDVSLDIPPNLPTVMADRDRIEEVLQNLLDNAIKYSPRRVGAGAMPRRGGGGTEEAGAIAFARVVVACRATGNEVIVSVSDSGMGISLRDQEQIFKRFQRAGDVQERTLPGAGLGLYICRAIVEAHGGHIWVESTLHQGSTFSFSLPREEKARLPMVVF